LAGSVTELVGANTQARTVVLTGPGSYQIDVGGTLDHRNTVRHHLYFGQFHVRESPWFQPNISVTVANTGDTVVRAPRLVANGVGDWYDIDSLLTEVLAGADTDEQRALALFAFFARSDVQSHNNYMRCGPATPDRDRSPAANTFSDRANPVHAVTTWYASGCELSAVNMAIAARRAGLGSRVVMFSRPGAEFVGQHAAVEVFYDGGHHMFDPELRAYFLLRDNRTVASAAEVCADPDLVGRTHCLGPAGPDTEPGFWFDALYDSGTPLGVMPFDEWVDGVEYDLRPGERFEMRWSHQRRFHYGDKNDHDVPQSPWRLSNSCVALRVNGSVRATVAHLTAVDNLEVTPEGLRVVDNRYDGEVIVRMASPFPIVGGEIDLPDPAVRVALAQRDCPWRTIEPAADGSVSLDEALDHLRGRALREFHARLTVPASAPPLPGFEVRALVQLADTALPALLAGPNTLSYRDRSTGDRRIEITHVWQELDHPVPAAPEVSPVTATSADSVVLSWSAVDGPIDHHIDHHVVIAHSPGDPVAVCPDLDRLTGSGEPSWRVPAGWLRCPGRYVWRVRAISTDEVRGPWSAWSTLCLTSGSDS
jgi:hypothetical protein